MPLLSYSCIIPFSLIWKLSIPYKLWEHYRQGSYYFSSPEWGTKALEAMGNDCWEVILIYLIEHSRTTVTKMKLQCSISSSWLWFCVCLWLSGSTSKYHHPCRGSEVELFQSLGWCLIFSIGRSAAERWGCACWDHGALWSSCGIWRVFPGNPPQAGLPAVLGWTRAAGKALQDGGMQKHLFWCFCTGTEGSVFVWV